MKKYKKLGFIAVVLTLCFSFFYHHSYPSDHPIEKIFTVSAKSITKTLTFSGLIEPLGFTVISSSADGFIYEMPFHYGDEVKKGQLLFSIASDKFQATYKSALLQFIKAKTEFLNAQVQLKESTFLHQNKLISEDEFKTKESTFFNAQLAMIQAKEELSVLLKLLGEEDSDIFSLSIEKSDKIMKVLHMQNAQHQLRILAARDGVFLLASKNAITEGEAKKAYNGDQVKQGDMLGVLGDLSGLKIHIEVDEFSFNQLQLGQRVRVSETAFPELSLQGEITAIDSQGQLNRNGIPVFPVEITVKVLTAQEKEKIHIGMSALVEIQLPTTSKLSVPLKAVIEKNGLTYLSIKDKSTGKSRLRSVKTGATTQDSVVIESNLKEGDKIELLD